MTMPMTMTMAMTMKMSRGTYYRQVILRICTTASYSNRAGSQGSPAMGTEENLNCANILTDANIFLQLGGAYVRNLKLKLCSLLVFILAANDHICEGES